VGSDYWILIVRAIDVRKVARMLLSERPVCKFRANHLAPLGKTFRT
jgi:hypothetical protein